MALGVIFPGQRVQLVQPAHHLAVRQRFRMTGRKSTWLPQFSQLRLFRCLRPLGKGVFTQRRKRDFRASRQHGRQQASQRAGNQNNQPTLRRFFQPLQQRVGRLSVHHFRAVDNHNAPRRIRPRGGKKSPYSADHGNGQLGFVREFFEKQKVRVSAGLDHGRGTVMHLGNLG